MAILKLFVLVLAGLCAPAHGFPDFGHLMHDDDLPVPDFTRENVRLAVNYEPLPDDSKIDPYAAEKQDLTPRVLHRRQSTSGLYGNFNPNMINSQIGSGFDPNTLNGMGGSVSSGGMGTGSGGSSSSSSGSGSSGSGSSTGSGGMMGMFDPNAMMSSGGGGGGSTGGMSMFGNPSAMMGGGSSSSSASSGGSTSGGSSSGASSFGASSSTGGSSQSGVSSVSSPNYDPNNIVNTGAKYDPNAAGSPGGGGAGSAPSFANNMGMNASQQTPGGSPPGAGSSATSGAGPQNPASSFGSASTSGGSSSGSAQSSGSTGSTGAGSTSGGSGGSSTSGFDPVKTNSMATDGFNPLNPMIGKDMSSIMGPQAPTGGNNSFGFDPSKMNAQLGSQGMSLNMFGGAGGNTNLNKADAGSLMTGAQGMMAGSNTVLGGGNAVMSGGNMGTGSSSGTSSSSSSGGSSSGSTFDPNQTGSSSGSGSGSSSGGTFDPNLQSGSSSSGGSSGSGSSSTGGSTGGMNMFNPNAMLGGGSSNPMMPGGNMNPMMPGGNTNPMMPSDSMTGSRSNTGGNTILDPLGAMSGSARNFSGGNSLIDPMGFMGGGGLTGKMNYTFAAPVGRSVSIQTALTRGSTTNVAQRRVNTMDIVARGTYDHDGSMSDPQDEGTHTQNHESTGYGPYSYDPNRLAFMFTGISSGAGMMQSGGKGFVPSFVSSGMFQNAPNYQNIRPQHLDTTSNITTKRPANLTNQETTNHNDGVNFVGATTTDARSDIAPANGAQMIHIMPPSIKDQIPESVLNITSLFPKAQFRGQPGMLGVGSERVIPQPSQINIPLPTFRGYPGMPGDSNDGKPNDTGNQTSTDTGVDTPSAMMTQDISMYEHVMPVNNYGSHSSHAMSGNSQGNDTQFNPYSGIQEVKPMTEGYNWNGDWPGNSESETKQDWSSGWAKNWEKKGEEADATSTVRTSSIAEDKGEAMEAGFMLSSIAGSEAAVHSTPDNQDQIGTMQKTLDVFQKFLAFLKDLNVPVSGNSLVSDGASFNDMANSWAKDVHA